MFRYLPEQASEIAPKIDFVNNLITDLSVFFTAAIVGAMIYFAIRYRRTEDNKSTPAILGSHSLEILWTVIPTVISVFIAYEGLIYYFKLREVPADAMVINVTAQKWVWNFEYDNGKTTTGEMVIPVDRPVKFLMTSRDILHSFFVPAMRVKADVVPGRYSYVTFKPVKTGEYHTFCTEYCGTNHWNMRARLRVVSATEFDAWLNDRSEELRAARVSPAERGQLHFVNKGCNACHSLDGSRLVGPSFAGLYGSTREFADGTSAPADENYIRTSILNPAAQIVKGYPNAMIAFEGQITDDEITDLIAFMNALNTGAVEVPKPAEQKVEDLSKLAPPERGQKLITLKGCNACHSMDGNPLVGPTFKGLYGRSGKLADGQAYTADDAYIKESILNSAAKIVEGYQPLMPPYAGQVSDEEVADIIEYLKTIK